MSTTRSFYTFSLELLSCRVLSDTNLVGNYFNGFNGIGATFTASSPGALTVDSILLNQGDDVLLNNQTITSQNGIYTLTQQGTATSNFILTRRADFQSIAQMVEGQFLTISTGTIFAGTTFILIEPLPTVIGVSAIKFSPSATGGTGFLLAANNLSDVQSAATSRTNLGLGTAATKNVSNNALPTVSSISGAFTAGHAIVATDVNGTIQDSGTTLGTAAAKNVGDFLQPANNLSDVLVPATARTNLGLGSAAVENNSFFLQSANNFDDLTDFQQANFNLFTRISETTGRVFNAGDYAITHVCSGATSYTITLPTPINGEYIDFVFIPTNNALITIIPQAGTIDGQPLLVYGAGEGGRFYTNGTDWFVMWQKLQPVSFSANMSAPVNVIDDTFTQLPMDTTTYNVGGFYDTGTFRFTPLLPGKYYLTLQAIFTSPAVTNMIVDLSIFHNGSMEFESQEIGVDTVPWSIAFSINFEFNGTTDFVEPFIAQQNSGMSTLQVDPNPFITFFQGFRISNF